MSSRVQKRQRKESKLNDPTDNSMPSINQDRLAPRGAFILPQEWVQGLMSSHLPDLEGRMVREINRLEVWVQNLQTQLNAAHNEVERLQSENAELQGKLDKRPVLSIPM